MLASQSKIGGHRSTCSIRIGSRAQAHCSIQSLRPRNYVVTAAGNGSVDIEEDQKKGDDLSERILSGEFTDSGSTKEKLTRPVRKLLAQDPVGVGERAGWVLTSRVTQQAHTHAHHTPGV
eukprot:GHRQ01011581.1.p1 GENE.GHRQ01011581.1~~GHRQ01011581.1.p1  ORF type:complete len:120 (+),score=16.80 GHRQ01011581.1:879-1238(+)